MHGSSAGTPSFVARRNLPNHQLSWSNQTGLMRNFHDGLQKCLHNHNPVKCHVIFLVTLGNVMKSAIPVGFLMLSIKTSHRKANSYLPWLVSYRSQNIKQLVERQQQKTPYYSQRLSECPCIESRADLITKSLLHPSQSFHPLGNLDSFSVDSGITVMNS